MLAGLPAGQQRALVATAQRAVMKAGRTEKRFQGKMGQMGNLKMTEHYLCDVPFGPKHRCRFPT